MVVARGAGAIRRHRGVSSRTVAWALVVLTVLSGLAASAGPASAETLAKTHTRARASASLVRLSNLHSLTRWAYPSYEAPVRDAPSQQARVVGHLRFLTGDGQAELYIALAAEHGVSGIGWVRIELPGRPDGKTGWIPREALGSMHRLHSWLLVDQLAERATLYRNGRAIFHAPVGTGKPSTVTPSGHFYVMEKLITLNAPLYGPYALGTSAYAPTLSEWPGGGVVGIHGTDEPGLVPGHPSHGCVRMHNADMARLWRMVSVGTPIEIT
jgi:hypothetical protein